MWYASYMLILKNRPARPNRARRAGQDPVTLKIIDNQGRKQIVNTRPGDTLDINHTIDAQPHPNVQLRVEARAARIQVVG